jgi:hypothetical protein
MFLTYGQDHDKRLVYIADARRGRAYGLFCPFCGGPLAARKGTILAHHFAHQTQTCRPASPRVRGGEDILPSYAGLVMGLTPAQRKALQDCLTRGPAFYVSGIHVTTLRSLVARRFLSMVYAPDRAGRVYSMARITDRARAFDLRLSLVDFAHLVRVEYERSCARFEDDETPEGATARRMLDAERERIRQTDLYLLAIRADGNVYHKVGITTRPIAERVAEVRAFLRAHFREAEAWPLFHLPEVSYVEAYFKARYAAYRLPLGEATEYFDFGDAILDVQRELTLLYEAVKRGFSRPAASKSRRPRFRAVLVRYEQRPNTFTGYDELAGLFADVIYVDSGERYADYQFFRVGKTLDKLDLQPGDEIEFNATPGTAWDSGDPQLKRPGNVVPRLRGGR